METTVFEMPQQEARQKWIEMLGQKARTPLDLTRKRVYHAMSKGQKVLDIYTVLEQTGLNEKGEPRIGICRADAKKCHFVIHTDGSGIFSQAQPSVWESQSWRGIKSLRDDVLLAADTFPRHKDWRDSKLLMTPVPPVPVELRPDAELNNYFVLWEVPKWAVIIPRDPLLLRRIGTNMFAILAEWNLTDLEYSIARGAL